MLVVLEVAGTGIVDVMMATGVAGMVVGMAEEEEEVTSKLDCVLLKQAV